MQTYDDDDDDDLTQFEPNPWGARQRIAPRRAFKAVVSRIVTLVPSLVRQLPPPIPQRRIPRATPASATPTIPTFAASARISAPVLPARIPSIGALAAAARERCRERTLPVKRVQVTQLKRIVSVLAGAVVALTIALVARSMHQSQPARASMGASLAHSLTSEQPRHLQMPVTAPASAMTVTPIEPTVPSVDEVSQPAKPIAKKRKKPRR